MATKQCPACGQTASLSAFYREPSRGDGRSIYCKKCERARKKTYHASKRSIRDPLRSIVGKSKKGWTVADRRAYEKVRHTRLRAEMKLAYGSRCECCGESESEFLTLEHRNHDGKAHRALGNTSVLVDLKRRGWPKDSYTLLCMNCYWAERNGKPCPHKLRPKFIVVG